MESSWIFLNMVPSKMRRQTSTVDIGALAPMEKVLNNTDEQRDARFRAKQAASKLAERLAKAADIPKDDLTSLFESSPTGTAVNSFTSAAEHALKCLENRVGVGRERMLQAALISSLGDGMIIIDTDRTIFVINERAKTMLAYDSVANTQELPYGEVIRLTDRDGKPIGMDRNPIELAFETGKPVRVTFMDDIYWMKMNGDAMPVTISASPIVIGGETKGIVAIFEDVTEEKKIDEIKSDFIYIASHQLRTPLTVSTLHTEMLLAGHGGELTKEQKEFLSEIHFYNKKMAQLLSIFMTVSKIELGTFVMQYKPTDLSLIMDDVLHELGTQIKNKKLKVEKKYSSELITVETDPEFMRIVFQNLVSNAVKYTPHEGHIDISISKHGESAIATVTDTGCGIPLNEQSQVFSKLYRGTNTKNHRWESNGLGLYITKSIIEKCSGAISFSSKEDVGTTFTVKIPLKAPEKHTHSLKSMQ